MKLVLVIEKELQLLETSSQMNIKRNGVEM